MDGEARVGVSTVGTGSVGCVSRTPSIDFEAIDRDLRFGVGTLG